MEQLLFLLLQMHFFLSDEIIGDEIRFAEDEAKHMLRSLRLTDGDEIWVLDGQGTKYRCFLHISGKKNVLGLIHERMSMPEPTCKLHLAIAPTKNSGRLEWFVEKGTELGVSEITFLETRRSERVRVNQDRIRKIAQSALKQSGNFFMPVFNEVTLINDFLARDFAGYQGFIAHCQRDGLPHLADEVQAGKDMLIMIGPEGDFTIDEIKVASAKGFKEISLGSLRLRTETAGIFVTSLVAIINRRA